MSSEEIQTKTVPPNDSDEKGGILRGFSLIELMLVIAIISILAAVAFISMMHYELVIRANASARDLGGQMRLVRSAAIKAGRSHKFVFGTAGYAYGIDPNETASNTFEGVNKVRSLQPGITWGYMANTVEVPGHPYPVACSVYIGNSCGGEKRIFFRRDGTISVDGVAYLIPDRDMGGTGARDDRERAVDWSASSGRIRVWKYSASAHRWR